MHEELEKDGKLVFAKMPNSLVYRLKWFAESEGIPVWQVVHNLLIREWAMSAAQAKAAGGYKPRPLSEFQRRMDDILLTGEVLFINLVEQYTKDLQQEEALHRWEGPTEAMKQEKRRRQAAQKRIAELEQSGDVEILPPEGTGKT